MAGVCVRVLNGVVFMVGLSRPTIPPTAQVACRILGVMRLLLGYVFGFGGAT